jgi:N-terminal acetyltransferase B complex catalytic subunit
VRWLTRPPAQFGYSVYRQVIGYYSGEEDAYGARPARLQVACCPAHAFLADMRKAMPRDVHKKSVIPLKRPVKPSELDDD